MPLRGRVPPPDERGGGLRPLPSRHQPSFRGSGRWFRARPCGQLPLLPVGHLRRRGERRIASSHVPPVPEEHLQRQGSDIRGRYHRSTSEGVGVGVIPASISRIFLRRHRAGFVLFRYFHGSSTPQGAASLKQLCSLQVYLGLEVLEPSRYNLRKMQNIPVEPGVASHRPPSEI